MTIGLNESRDTLTESFHWASFEGPKKNVKVWKGNHAN